jgi:diacylglycerol kinase (ATP)
MDKISRIAIILNPNAGRGKAIKAEKEIVNSLRKRNTEFILERTKCPLDAISIAQRLSNDFQTIIAAGGDGTANEVARGLIGTKATMGYIPIGSGNDFNKTVCMPLEIPQMIDKILAGKTRLIDVGNVKIKNSRDKIFIGRFINTVGMGIDAAVAKEAKQIKYIRGLLLYLFAALKALSFYKTTKFSIKLDNEEFEEKSFLLCVGNGKFEGGGFNMVPSAEPDDGHFDICLVKKMPIWDALNAIPMVIRGTHGSHKQVIMRQASKIELAAKEPFIVHADGEILEEKALKIEIEIAQEKLLVIVA